MMADLCHFMKFLAYDYFRPEAPYLSDCYRRAARVAACHGTQMVSPAEAGSIIRRMSRQAGARQSRKPGGKRFQMREDA